MFLTKWAEILFSFIFTILHGNIFIETNQNQSFKFTSRKVQINEAKKKDFIDEIIMRFISKEDQSRFYI